jgi:hypothetical protein
MACGVEVCTGVWRVHRGLRTRGMGGTQAGRRVRRGVELGSSPAGAGGVAAEADRWRKAGGLGKCTEQVPSC